MKTIILFFSLFLFLSSTSGKAQSDEARKIPQSNDASHINNDLTSLSEGFLSEDTGLQEVFLDPPQSWLKRAVNRQFMLGVFLVQTRIWLKEEISQAKTWFTPAANQGDVEAQFKQANVEQAKIWLEEAANQGHVEARLLLREILVRSEQILQDVRESVFKIIINGAIRGTGFVVEGDTLVTDFHVYNGHSLSSLSIENTEGEKFYIDGVREINLLDDLVLIIINGASRGTGFVVEGDTLVTDFHVYNGHSLSSLSIENTEGEKFYIDGVREINLLADLVLFKIKNYKGPSLDIENSTEADLSNRLFLVGFPTMEFRIIKLTKEIKSESDSDNIYRSFGFTPHLRMISGASGSPIVNAMGKVVAVAGLASGVEIFVTRGEILQSLLNKTRHQEIISNDESIVGWIQQEYVNLSTLAIQGDVDAQFRLGTLFSEKSEIFLKKSADQGHRLAKVYLWNSRKSSRAGRIGSPEGSD